MKLLTQKQARELDILSLESSKIKGAQLMEAAGKIIADFLMDCIQNIDKESIGIVCGKGNNGGDGFASATFLHSKKYRIQIFCICSLDDLSNDSQYFANKDLLVLDAPLYPLSLNFFISTLNFETKGGINLSILVSLRDSSAGNHLSLGSNISKGELGKSG